MKSRKFWEVLERISVLYVNTDEHTYIRVAFRKLHAEKNIQIKVFKNLNRIYNFPKFLVLEFTLYF